MRIAQPALSRQIRLLEETLKTPLFIRSVRGVALSEAGERLLPHAQAIMDQIAAIPDLVSDQNCHISGRVVIGVPTATSAVLSKPLLDVARKALPGVQLHLVESLSGFLAKWLQDHTLDFSILYDPEPYAHVEFEQLLVEELALVGTLATLKDTHKVRLSDLIAYPLVLPSHSHALRRLLETVAARHHQRLNVAVEIDSLPIMKAAIQSGEYFSVLAPTAIQSELSTGLLHCVPVVDPVISRMVTLAHSSDRAQTRASREVARLVRDVVRQLQTSGIWKSSSYPGAET